MNYNTISSGRGEIGHPAEKYFTNPQNNKNPLCKAGLLFIKALT